MISLLHTLAKPPQEWPDQKFDRVIAQYIRQVQQILRMDKPEPGDFKKLTKCMRARDELFKKHPELKLRWEAIMNAAGPSLFLPSSL